MGRVARWVQVKPANKSKHYRSNITPPNTKQETYPWSSRRTLVVSDRRVRGDEWAWLHNKIIHNKLNAVCTFVTELVLKYSQN